MRAIFDILHQDFQDDQLNSRRFPGGFLNFSRFPGVVDTLSLSWWWFLRVQCPWSFCHFSCHSAFTERDFRCL